MKSSSAGYWHYAGPYQNFFLTAATLKDCRVSGILRSCHQTCEEAAPLFYRSIYVGCILRSSDSRLLHTQLAARLNVREAAFKFPWEYPRALNLWLGPSKPFDLKHCKLFLDGGLPLWPPSFALVITNAVILERELAEVQRKFTITDY